MSTPDPVRSQFVAVGTELQRRSGYKFATYFPDCLPACRAGSLRIDDHVTRPGFPRPNCRVLYPRSLTFFAAGTVRNPDGSYRYRERMFLAANRTSKTVSAAFETTAHLTGKYPPWWPGRRFEHPIEAWAAGDTRETTRDIIQLELLGPRDNIRAGDLYGGMIPGHLILDRTLKTGVADCVDTVWVKHVERQHGAPCTSPLQFKAYDQGRLAFQGTSKHLVWLDEEPPDAKEEPAGGGAPSGNGDVVTECLLRTATTDGLLMYTFTPLRGLTPFVDHYLESADMADPDGRVINAKVGLFGNNEARVIQGGKA